MKRKNKIAGRTGLFMAGVLLFSSLCGTLKVDAKEGAKPSSFLLRPVVIELSPDKENSEFEEKTEYEGITAYKKSYLASGAYSEEKDDFFYKQLSSDEQVFYDNLYSVSEELLNGDEDAISIISGENEYFLTKPAEYSGINPEDAKKVAWIFQNNNPKFYFLGRLYALTDYPDENRGTLQISVLDEFIKGEERKVATDELFSVSDLFRDEILLEETEEGRIKKAYDLILENVSPSPDDEEDLEINQSCYSALILKKSVCAGYSESLSLLLNSVGIETIVLTSDTHEWNAVRKNDGSWRLYDATWDDDEGEFLYEYFDLSLDEIKLRDEAAEKRYNIEERYLSYLPDLNGNDDAAEDILRIYNPNSGEHFYTKSIEEKDFLESIGWIYESVLSTQTVRKETPVYRLYNSLFGGHFYTTSVSERRSLIKSGWTDEGIGWYSPYEMVSPVYRIKNPNDNGIGSHNFTRDTKEVVMLLDNGWILEGVGWNSY